MASPLGLGEIGLKIANHQTKSMIDGLCCSVEGRQDKNIMKMSQLLRLSGGMGAAALNNQNLPRKVGEHIRMGNLIALPLPPMTLLPLATSLGMARSLAPTMIDLPSLEGIDPNNPDVRTMDETQRMLWVLLKCGEILDQTGKSEVAAAFKQLLEPEVIGLVVAGLIVWGASHFVGIGFVFDIAMVVVIGVAVLKAFETMWEIYKIITKASSTTDLNRAAKMMADMVIDIGVETFLAIVLKGASKSRFRAPPSKASGSADEAVELAPTRKRGGERKPEPKKDIKKKAPSPYKTGANLHGRKIEQVKQGNDDPIVLIGTKMDGDDGVIAVAEKLEAEGKNVEILEDSFLDGKKWDIDGEEWDVDSAWKDMVRNKKWDKYRHKSGPNKGRVKDAYLDKLPMYKLNEKWIESKNNSGATILDIGNPVKSNSLFYIMEQRAVSWGQ